VTLIDRLGRPFASLRISVTDRCNLRCRYCMPEDEYVWLPRTSILSYEEIERLVRVCAGVGVSKIRLTGGEPLLRQDLAGLVRRLAPVPGITDLALTTNGLLLGRHASALRAAGLRRVTVSLDTLRPERMRDFARSEHHADVLAGIAAARDAGLQPLKLNAVIVRGFNDDEIADLVAFARAQGSEIRFIEYMDVGGATQWSRDAVVSRAEILAAVAARFGPVTALPDQEHLTAPAERFALPDGTTFGVIASTTAPFCRTCDRGRLTADGRLYGCLYAREGLDLREPLRAAASDEHLADLIGGLWRARSDRGAEERLAVPGRGILAGAAALRADPHLEMHTRGG
jgi:cyclic pyranopterin phosphate synthase